jgi:hypothetical protein
MAKRIIAVIILVPVAIIAVAFSVANRHAVSLTLDPFHPGNPALSYSAPFFVWLFAALVLGLVVGGLTVWLGQGRHRRLSRQRGKEAERLRRDAEEAERRRRGADAARTMQPVAGANSLPAPH